MYGGSLVNQLTLNLGVGRLPLHLLTRVNKLRYFTSCLKYMEARGNHLRRSLAKFLFST